MYSLYKGGGGPWVLPWKILKNLECRKGHLPHFLGLFFIFLFFINQFSLAGRFESYLVADPEGRFSSDEAHLYVGYRCEEG